jgi:hypothetical protein
MIKAQEFPKRKFQSEIDWQTVGCGVRAPGKPPVSGSNSATRFPKKLVNKQDEI